MGNKDKPDWSFAILLIAVGIVLGGTLAVPISTYALKQYASTFEVNGQIGDFVGGLLNPVIALLAFVWLRKGVISQQQELKETRSALRDGATAQRRQAEISAYTLKIAALTALLEALNREESELNKEMANYIEDGRKIGMHAASNEHYLNLQGKKKRIRDVKISHMDELDEYLRKADVEWT